MCKHFASILSVTQWDWGNAAKADSAFSYCITADVENLTNLCYVCLMLRTSQLNFLMRIHLLIWTSINASYSS